MNRAFRFANSAIDKLFERKVSEGWLPRGHIDGLILSNDAGDTTNDIGIASGVCRSTVNSAYVYSNAYSTLARHQRDIEITDAIIKQIDVVWAPGNGGGRSASALSNTTWHKYAIGGKGLRDSVFFHDSATQSSVLAAMPGGYTAYRRIGSIIRSGAAIVAFTQIGDYFERQTTAADISAANPGASAVTRTLSVPTGIVVSARLYLSVVNVAAGGVTTYSLLTALTSVDQTPSSTVSQTAGAATVAGFVTSASTEVSVYTNTSAQIRSRLSASDASVTLVINTRGWIDTRGRDA